jgi:hypothetical protein
LDIPFNKDLFEKIKDDFFSLSVAKHPDIFCDKFSMPKNLQQAKNSVNNYFQDLFKGGFK